MMKKFGMQRTLIFSLVAFALSTGVYAEKKKKTDVKIWTDPEKAAAEAPSFKIQGEYQGKNSGVQVAAMSQGEFLVLTYAGGLPGDKWDGGKLKSEIVKGDAIQEKIAGLEKVSRTSPTMGKKAPEGAIILFDGEATEHIKGEVKDGLLWSGAKTVTKVGDFHLHIEFRLPFKPDRTPSSQDRGNSGLYIFNNYEIQVLDTFGLDFNKENNAVKLQSDSKQWCGCFYKFKHPDVPMARPPLTWQTYDVDFTAAKFEGEKKVTNARITVRHNGVLIHDDVELQKGTGAGGGRPEKAADFIYLQGHGNPVAYRNFWIIKK